MLRIGIGLAIATGTYFARRDRRRRDRSRGGSAPPTRRRRRRKEGPYSDDEVPSAIDQEIKSNVDDEDWTAVQPWRKRRRANPRLADSVHGSSDVDVDSGELSDLESMGGSAAAHCPSYDLIVASDSLPPSSRPGSRDLESQALVPYVTPRVYAPANVPQYIYKPLMGSHAIRLIELHPAARFSDGIAFRFLHVDLELLSERQDDFSYEALSYVWGNHTMQNFAYCYDSTGHASPPAPSYCHQPITASLDCALRRLRYPDRSRILWVDQLCINQENVAEKNHQVRQMAAIYESAGRVLACVGDDQVHGEKTLSAIKSIGKWIVNECNSGRPPSTATAQRIFEERLLTTFGPQGVDHVQRFFLRPFFRRRWVIQELVCAHKSVVICGAKECKWEYFAAAIQFFHQVHLRDAVFKAPVLETIESLRYIDFLKRTPSTMQDMGILDYLSLFHAAECGNDKDRIIALLGISDDESSYEGIDYRLSTEDLYRRFAVQSIDHSGLDILHLAGALHSTPTVNSCLKSWMPDWRAESLHRSFISVSKFRAGTPIEADSRKCELMWVTEHGSLLVEGFALDTAAVTSKSTSRTPDVNEIIRSLPQWIELGGIEIDSNRDGHSRPKLHSAAKALAMTLIADHGHYEGTGLHLPRDDPAIHEYRKRKLRLSAWRGFRELLGRLPTEDHTLHPPPPTLSHSSDSDPATSARRGSHLSKHARRYAQLVGTTMSGRRLFRTHGGRVGVGPAAMRSGDLVAILLGARTPFVLRPDRRGERFMLVGDAYVHHCMDGRMATGAERQFFID